MLPIHLLFVDGAFGFFGIQLRFCYSRIGSNNVLNIFTLLLLIINWKKTTTNSWSLVIISIIKFVKIIFRKFMYEVNLVWIEFIGLQNLFAEKRLALHSRTTFVRVVWDFSQMTALRLEMSHHQWQLNICD